MLEVVRTNPTRLQQLTWVEKPPLMNLFLSRSQCALSETIWGSPAKAFSADVLMRGTNSYLNSRISSGKTNFGLSSLGSLSSLNGLEVSYGVLWAVL